LKLLKITRKWLIIYQNSNKSKRPVLMHSMNLERPHFEKSFSVQLELFLQLIKAKCLSAVGILDNVIGLHKYPARQPA
jgi:hypothetical protein